MMEKPYCWYCNVHMCLILAYSECLECEAGMPERFESTAWPWFPVM